MKGLCSIGMRMVILGSNVEGELERSNISHHMAKLDVKWARKNSARRIPWRDFGSLKQQQAQLKHRPSKSTDQTTPFFQPRFCVYHIFRCIAKDWMSWKGCEPGVDVTSLVYSVFDQIAFNYWPKFTMNFHLNSSMFRSVVEGFRLLPTTHDICGPKLAHQSLGPRSSKSSSPHLAPTSLSIHFPPTRAGAKFFSAQQSEFFKKGSWVPATCRAVEQECWFRHGFNLMFDIPSIYQYLIILLSTLIQWDQQISFSSKPGYLIFPWIPFSTILVGQTMILLQTLQMNCACQLPVWVRSPRRHQMRNGSK